MNLGIAYLKKEKKRSRGNYLKMRRMALPLIGTSGGCGKSVSSTSGASEIDMASTCVSTERRR